MKKVVFMDSFDNQAVKLEPVVSTNGPYNKDFVYFALMVVLYTSLPKHLWISHILHFRACFLYASCHKEQSI